MMNHNRKIMWRYDSKDSHRSNCRVKEECPLNGAYLVRDVVYEDKAIRRCETKNYIGDAEGEWQIRFYDHKKSLGNRNYKMYYRSFYLLLVNKGQLSHGKYWLKPDHMTELVKEVIYP